MSIASAIDTHNEFLNTIGKAGLNALYPNDFEAYFIALELVDSSDKILEFFTFPIMPNSLSITEPEITNIKKVNKGITSLKTDSFISKDISISGTFGRNFRILIRDQFIDFNSFRGGLGLLHGDFEGPTIKTGFGSIKILQKILENSKILDQKGKPVRLYFYNFAFSENYVVEVIDKSFSQSKESNMIWNYNINLKAVAPINNTVRSKSSLISILTSGSLQKNINSLASNINSALPKL
jgi:hypothetical protein